MNRVKMGYAALASSLTPFLATAAMAAGDSGTSSMGEMTGAGTLLMMVGGMIVMGGVIWLIVKMVK